MKLKKLDVYKIEFKILLYLVLIVILTVVTMMSTVILKDIVRRVLIVCNLTQQIPRIRYILPALGNYYETLPVFIFIVYFHLIFRKKIRAFLEINRAVKDMANGEFNTRIDNSSEDEIGMLAQNINKVMDKFNSTIEEERKSEQTKIDLITSISHDLRTPLTSILGYLKLVDNDEYDDEFTIRSYVNIALNKTKRLKVLIDDLFELTTLNNYGIKISKIKLNIVELIKQLAVEHRISFDKAGIQCRLNLSEEKLYVLGDSIKLARAFENLIVNCIKYSKTSDFMDISVYKDQAKVFLEFTNYGEPIPPIDIPYVFQRFYRVDKARSQETGGSGLGLAITKNVVELHDGKISVESNPIKTTFKIELPCINEESEIYDQSSK